MNLEAWHYWVITGVILLILEMMTVTFFLASFGVAALGAALTAACGASFTWQLASFAAVSIAAIGLVRPAFVTMCRSSDPRSSNANALVGQLGTVVDEIEGGGLSGRVKLGGEEWRALSFTDERISSGTLVEVARVEGATISVKVKPHSTN